MVKVSLVYQDVLDSINMESNGHLSYPMFNRYSKLAELLLLDWITGDISGQQPPEPYLTMKNKDYASPFIAKHETIAKKGAIDRPKDYYGFENMYLIGRKVATACDEDSDTKEQDITDCNTPIELLDGGQFHVRCKTYIDGLQPSLVKPIAKMVGNTFEFAPKDIGSIALEYYRYPKFAEIKTTTDPIYNDEVVDEATSINYEWDEKAIPILVWFIVDRFSNRTGDRVMKEMNIATKKTGH